MRAVQAQFFLYFATVGSVAPLLAVFLRDVKDFTTQQIGYALSISSLAAVVTPGLTTLLADLNVRPQRIFLVGYVICLLGLLGLFVSPVVGLTLLAFGLYSFATVPLMPLQDGFYFSLAKSQPKSVIPYHRVRVWGTVGFLVPSLVFVLLLGTFDLPTITILYFAGAMAVLAAANTFLLPRLHDSQTEERVQRGFPTRDALKLLFSPPIRLMAIGLIPAFFASAAFYGFFPLYLKDIAGLQESRLGLIMNLGVAIEIVVMLGLRFLITRFGIRRLMVFGLTVMSVRMGLLALLPGLWTAIGIQIFHPFEVLALFVLPVIYLNDHAGDHFRNSVQGVYMMVISGISRIIGASIAGYLASESLLLVMGYGSVLGGAGAMLVLIWYLREKRREAMETRARPC